MEEDNLTGIQVTYNPFLDTSDFVPYTQFLPIDSELTHQSLSEIVRSTGILPIDSVVNKKAVLIDFIREMQVTNKIKLSAFSMIRNKIEELW